MVLKKRQSKRQTLSHKYKVQRKVKEHNRKARRDAKKGVVNGTHRKLKKDPGIPNTWPFKEQMMQQIEVRRERAEEQKKQQKAERKEAQRKKRLSLTSMVQDAQQRGATWSEDQAAMEADASRAALSGVNVRDSSRRAYFREFRKLVDEADVIVEVLDARDPLGCRCPAIERMILSSNANKRIVLVLNKIDLIPHENAMAWLKYLRNEFPTIAFKASTQNQKSKLAHNRASATTASRRTLESGAAVGVDALMKLLKNYSRSEKMKTAITVGLIGYPNVGKSSIINSLKRERAVGVGATPGFTKVMQTVALDSKVRLLDSPGIVFASEDVGADVVLRNCVKVEQLADPVTPVRYILQRCGPAQLQLLYKTPAFRTHDEFLTHVAKQRTPLRRGGIVDIEAAARIVLNDWNAGKIPFCTQPPEERLADVHLSAAVVQSWGKAFDVDAVFAEHDQDVLGVAAAPNASLVTMKPAAAADDAAFGDAVINGVDDDDDDDDDDMDDGDDEGDNDDDDGDEDVEEDEEGEEMDEGDGDDA